MPTYIRLAYQEPRSISGPKELSAVSNFLMIGLIQLAVAILAGAQLGAAFAEQSIW
ncbi:MAG: hypothetical protein WBQ22_17570 [Bradyrhizobium sp.]